MVTITGIAADVMAAVHKMNGISMWPAFGAIAFETILCVGFGQLLFLA